MVRVKRGTNKHRRHKKILERTSGFVGSPGRRIRQGKVALVHAGAHAYRSRRQRKRDFRSLWIVRINAAARGADLTYSQLMAGLRKANVGLDRKSLAETAVRDPQAFQDLVALAKQSLGA